MEEGGGEGISVEKANKIDKRNESLPVVASARGTRGLSFSAFSKWRRRFMPREAFPGDTRPLWSARESRGIITCSPW